jgi:hypothetical protein
LPNTPWEGAAEAFLVDGSVRVALIFLEGEWGDSLLPPGVAEPAAGAAAFASLPFKEKTTSTKRTDAARKRTGIFA